MYKVVEVGGSGREIALTDGKRLYIGRDPSQCLLCLPERAAGVSRVHAFLELRKGAPFLVDESTHGTLVNSAVVLKTACAIRADDSFLIGEHAFRLLKVQKSVFDGFDPSQRAPVLQVNVAQQHIVVDTAVPSTSGSKIKKGLQEKSISKNEGKQQKKISSFFGARSQKASARNLDEDDDVLAVETVSSQRSFDQSSQRLNRTVVPDSCRTENTTGNTAVKKLPLLSKRKLSRASIEPDEPVLADDSLRPEQAQISISVANTSVVSDTQKFAGEDNSNEFRSFTNSHRSQAASSVKIDDEDDDDIVFMPSKPVLRKNSVRPQIGSAAMRSQMRTQRPSFSIAGRCLTETSKNSAVHTAKTSSLQKPFPSSNIQTSENCDGEIVLPTHSLRNTMATSSEAPTFDVRTISEAFQAVSPKKNVGEPVRKRGRLQDTSIIDQIEREELIPRVNKAGSRTLKDKSGRENVAHLKIDDVKEDFENLKSQLCSGKVKEEEEWDEEILRANIQKEQSMIEEVRQNIDKMVSFVDLSRCSTPLVTRPAPSGHPNFKRFRKAAQGRFNNSFVGTPTVRLAGDDLVDYRKINCN